MEWAVAPIPIKKSTQDLSAIKNIMQVVKEGGTICIFPEGNRTYSGCTEYIKPAITKLIKMTGLPVILMNLQGGYGKEPRWSTKSRKGKVTCTVKRIIEADEYKQMSPADFYNAVTQDLYINDTNSESSFKSKNRAEYAERLLYVCPGFDVSSFCSNGNIISFKKCGLSAEFTEKLKIKPCDSNQQILPYTTIKEWYDSQEHFIENLNLQNYQDTPAFSEKVRLYKVRLYKKKILIDKDCALDLFSNRYEIIYSSEKIIMNYDEVKAVSVLGRNKLNIYFKNEVFQIKSDKRFNAVKYLHFYHHYKNTKSERETKGDGHDFLRSYVMWSVQSGYCFTVCTGYFKSSKKPH